jgi:pimeloyl-ACP methyl ester carboxylesterase
MKEERFWFGDVDVKYRPRGPGRAREAALFFHGFPGRPPVAEAHKYPLPHTAPWTATTERLHAVADVDVYLASYEGIDEGHGHFTFMRSVTRSEELGLDLSARGYQRIHVVGHSWGAFVAANVHRALGDRAGRRVFLAGILDLPDEKSIRTFITPYLSLYPELFVQGDAAMESAVADLDAARRAYNPMSRPDTAPDDQLLLIVARDDAYADPETQRLYHRLVGGRLVEFDDDHIFSRSRPAVERLLADFLAGTGPSSRGKTPQTGSR